jgi:ATP-dependent Zn protease
MDLLKQLKDIKPNANIVDYKFYAFLIVSLLTAALILFLLFKFFKKKQNNPYLQKLKNLNFKDSKKTAYEFTRYAKYFVNEENEAEYEKIVKSLNRYKYKPNVDDLENELINEIKRFVEGLK